MGIHNFHKWLKDNCSKCYTSTRTPFISEYVYIDINFALHNCIYGTKSYGVLIKKLIGFIDNALNSVIPAKKIVLATDGPAPFAKLLLQRKRRLQMARKLDDTDINDKTITPLWFTPGTNFMVTIDKELKGYFDSLQKRFNITVDALFSGSDEAEVKLMRSLIKNNKHATDRHTFISNDADVVVMTSSIVNFSNVYIGIKSNKEIELFNIGKFVSHLNVVTDNKNLNSNVDFAMLSLMMGNDYLPKILCVTFEKLWDCYKKTLKKCKISLVTIDNRINPIFMTELMSYLCVSMTYGWIQKFRPIDLNVMMYKDYLEGLTWCLDIYRTGECRKYDYMYDYDPPHPLGILYYLKFIDSNIKVEYPLKPIHIMPELYALLLLPKKAKCLINKKYHKLMDTQLKFLYEEEECKTCVALHVELSGLNKSYAFMKAMGEDLDEISKKVSNISVKMGKHKKIHKDLTMKDVQNILMILN